MKKFTQFREQLESNRTFKVTVELTIEVTSKSEEEAISKVEEYITGCTDHTRDDTSDDIIKVSLPMINDVNEVFSKVKELNESKPPNLAIMNTQKMMQDYLRNRGATNTDSHYKNLEKILGIFQSTTATNMQTFQNPSVVVENKTEEVPTNDVDDSIEWTKTLISDYKKSGGIESSDQFQGYKAMLSMLQTIKKDK